MTLSDARQRVFYAVDDDGTSTADGSRWSVAEVDQKLRVALESVVTEYAAGGGTRLDEIVSVTTSDGYANLAAYRPLQIQSVRLSMGAAWAPVPAVVTSEFGVSPSGSYTLSVRLVRAPTFPDATSTSFTYGSGINTETIDALIVNRAARMLLVKDREVDNSLVDEYRELLRTALASDHSQQAYDMPSSAPRAAPYGYHYVPYGLYLGLRR